MLSSYKKNMGKLTVSMVNKSDVGVTIAARMSIITMAYRREARINFGVIIPNLESINIKMGSSNMMPVPILKVAIVDK